MTQPTPVREPDAEPRANRYAEALVAQYIRDRSTRSMEVRAVTTPLREVAR